MIPTSGCFRIGDWLIEPALDEISRGTEVVRLQPRMMRLLCKLAETPGQVISSQELLDSVWEGVVVGPASVYEAISLLRKTLGDTETTPTYIATVPRKGYRLVAAVERDANVAEQAPASSPQEVHTFPRRAFRLKVTAAVLTALALIIGFALRNEPASTIGEPAAAVRPVSDLPSIAVLSFQPAAADEASGLLAVCLTDLLHNRLATQKGLLVVSVASAHALRDPRIDVRDVGRRLHVRYVLRGDATRTVDQLRINVTLLDTSSGAPIWSNSYARNAQEVTALREEIVAQVGAKLQVRIGSVGNAPIDLPAYELYMRGRLAFSKLNKEGYSAAKNIYFRATTLYPDFARAYLALAESLHLLSYSDIPDAEKQKDKDLLIKSLDRALELDPDLGEAMTLRAEYIEDPAKAEEMYRRGLELAPSSDIGAYRYSLFLSNQGRVGEAIDAINRGLLIDPLSTILLQTKADILALGRGDVAGHEKLLRELVADHPNFPMARIGLGWSRFVWNGETAEGIGLFEQEIAREPTSIYARLSASAAYLDVDDPAAAFSVANGLPLALLEIAQFRQEPHPIALLPGDLQRWVWAGWSGTSVSSVGDALRDEAIATGNFAPALAMFEEIRSNHQGPPTRIRGMELVHAHTLILSGDIEGGRELAKSLLRLLEAEEVGRPKNWFARDRASIYAMLGDDERALAELTESVRRKDLARWWYTAELDPVFAHLRKDPRFQALATTAKQHRASQRALLEAMRRRGEVPKRP